MTQDAQLRDRAQHVIPGGMYGHKSVKHFPVGYPQFFAGGEGAMITDVDGNSYIDMMCSWGPSILGHHDAGVDAAVAAQLSQGDCLNGPQPVMVELAEAMTDRIEHADWAMFAKNGTDATTVGVRVARLETGRRQVIMATGSYHGIGSWSLPNGSPGITEHDSTDSLRCEYNDINSVEKLFAENSDIAAVVLTPFRHDVRRDLEKVDPAFAKRVRELCDEHGAVLILDDIRCGLRIDPRGSWAELGIEPDLSAWSKAIANGHPLAALLGRRSLESAASRITATGSFWLAAAPMAAALEVWRRFDDPSAMSGLKTQGRRFTEGLRTQAEAHGIRVTVSGHEALPFMTFAGDPDFTLANAWCLAALREGVYFHPTHNWFLGLQHDSAVIDRVLERTDASFAAVANQAQQMQQERMTA